QQKASSSSEKEAFFFSLGWKGDDAHESSAGFVLPIGCCRGKNRFVQGQCEPTPRPNPLPEAERGRRKPCSPSPLRGGGWGERVRPVVPRNFPQPRQDRMTHPTTPLTTASPHPVRSSSFVRNRWLQLAAGVIGMVAVANYQYGWKFFVEPIQKKYGWEDAEVQVAFTLFVLMETWLVPVEAYLVDRFGPFLMMLCGALLAGGGWGINAVADSLALLYTG